jgi:hypothetical protein
MRRRFGKAMVGVKRAIGGSSKHSHGSSSSHYVEPDEPKETPMQEEEEEEEEEEGSSMGTPRVEHRVDDADAPYLDLEGDQEIQAFNLIKSRVFVHTPTYDPDLLQKIGMDTEFTTIWRAIGGKTLILWMKWVPGI